MFNRACLTWCLSDVTQDVSPATLSECQRWADSAAGFALSISLDLQAPPFTQSFQICLRAMDLYREGFGRLCQGTRGPGVSRVQLELTLD